MSFLSNSLPVNVVQDGDCGAVYDRHATGRGRSKEDRVRMRSDKTKEALALASTMANQLIATFQASRAVSHITPASTSSQSSSTLTTSSTSSQGADRAAYTAQLLRSAQLKRLREAINDTSFHTLPEPIQKKLKGKYERALLLECDDDDVDVLK